MIKHFLLFCTVLFIYCGSSQANGFDIITKKALDYWAIGKTEEWKSLLSENVIIEAMGKRYEGQSEIDQYVSDLSLASVTTEITTSVSLDDKSASFAKAVEGTFKNGCPISVKNVVQLIRFNSNGQIEQWNEYWPKSFDQMKNCKIEL